MNEENRKKILIGSIIGVVTLVIVVVGATYAFFSLNVSGDTTNTNVDIETGSADVVSIKQGVESMHINLSVPDMASDKEKREHFATDVPGENYKTDVQSGTLTLATITGTNKEASDCTAKVTITMDTSEESMGRVLQKGDAKLYIASDITDEIIDLHDLLPEEISSSITKEIEVELSVIDGSPSTIKGYLKVNNTNTNQSYLGGKELNITIKVDSLRCEASKKSPIIAFLREDAGESLTKGLVGGMYRYQGTNDVPNWICFGTNDQTKCTDEYDKYMYRIIGVTEKGQLYLLKETILKEKAEIGFARNSEWHISGSSHVCPNGNCPEWNETDLFQRINGISNGTVAGNGNIIAGADTDIFVDNSYYDYLKSGDKVNGGEEESDWYKLIVTHSWYYGNTNEETKRYDGDTMYAIETGKAETRRNVMSEDGKFNYPKYTWENKVDAKISLMYIHDILYAYPEGKPGDGPNVKDSWIHFLKDGYNSGKLLEWLITSIGVYNSNSSRSYQVGEYGFITPGEDGATAASRPVFYIDGSKIVLDGEGTKEVPYYITNVE